MEAGSKQVSLLVLSGLHEGASQAVAAPSVRIGSGSGSDLMLADAGLAPAHVEVAAKDGYAELTALHDGVEIEGVGALAAGQQRRVPLPATFAVAGVRLCCDGPPPPPPPRPRRRRRVLLAIPAAALLLAAPGSWLAWRKPPLPAAPEAAGGMPDAAQGRPSEGVPDENAAAASPGGAAAEPAPLAASGGAPPSPAAGPAEAARSVPVRPMDPDAAAAALRDLLAAASLAGIQVDAVGEVVSATGAIPPGLQTRWQGVREAFDRRTGGRVMFSNAVKIRSEQPFKLSLDSVWTGNLPNIVINGSKYLEGGVLPNGWTLEHIERDRLRLRRGDAQVEVAF